MASNPKFIRLTGAERNDYVYRIISIEHLYDLLCNKENVVVSPRKWGDTEEKFTYQSRREPKEGWFGQCWTQESASDAMWRIYSKDSTGVRIRSKPSKLAVASRGTGWEVFVGKVEYLSEKTLKQSAKFAFGELNIAKMLLMKRRAFSCDAEVRLLMFRKGHTTFDDMERYKVNVADMIDQIMLDPRLPTCCANRLKKEISGLGFKGDIKHSQLYSPKPIQLD